MSMAGGSLGHLGRYVNAPRWGVFPYPDASDLAATVALWIITTRLYLDPGLARCYLPRPRRYPWAPQRALDRLYHRVWLAPGVDFDWR